MGAKYNDMRKVYHNILQNREDVIRKQKIRISTATDHTDKVGLKEDDRLNVALISVDRLTEY